MSWIIKCIIVLLAVLASNFILPLLFPGLNHVFVWVRGWGISYSLVVSILVFWFGMKLHSGK